MNEDYVSYEQAYQLKQLGFDWVCSFHYDSLELNHPLNITRDLVNYGETTFFKAPTLSQVQKWIYEKFGIWIDPTWSIIEHKFRWVARWIGPLCNGYNQEISNIIFDNPFEALSSGIDRVLEILKM